jgi:hypothetical protein
VLNTSAMVLYVVWGGNISDMLAWLAGHISPKQLEEEHTVAASRQLFVL